MASNSTPEIAGSTSRSGLFAVSFLGIASVVQVTDPIVANTAIVQASRELGMSGSVMALASSISTLALAATVLPMGLLGDRLGRRKVLMGSLLICVIGGIIAALSSNIPVYYVGRFLTGIGAGGSFTATYAYVRFVAEPGKIPASLGLWNLINTALFIVTSLLGGMLATEYGWRVAMLLAPAIALACALLTPIFLPAEPKHPGGNSDYPGMLAIGLGMISFLYGISQASRGWLAPEFLVPTAIGVVLFIVFYLIERQVESPSIPAQLFSNGIFSAGIVSGIAWNFAMAVVQLQTSNFWQFVQHFSTTEVAMAQLALVIPFAAISLVAGRLMGPGYRAVGLMGGGFIVIVASLIGLAFVGAETPFSVFAGLLVVFGSALAFVCVPQAVLFMQEAPIGSFGTVVAFRTTVGQLGYAAGFALSASLLNAFGKLDLLQRLREAGVPSSQLGEALDQVRLFMTTGKQGVGAWAQQITQDFMPAYTSGFNWTMGICACGIVVMGVLTVVLLLLGIRQKTLSL